MKEGKGSRLQITLDIGRQIYRRDGFAGFYRGYGASLMAYVPNSAMWWAFYHLYQGTDYINAYLFFSYLRNVSDELYRILPEWVSHLFIQSVAGTLGGFTTTIITNPLDIIRARLQVNNKTTRVYCI